jgi:hypothetical protein
VKEKVWSKINFLKKSLNKNLTGEKSLNKNLTGGRKSLIKKTAIKFSLSSRDNSSPMKMTFCTSGATCMVVYLFTA